MKTNFDDPRLTAYLLDELEPYERADLENELANSPELAVFLDELRQKCDDLTASLHREAQSFSLTESQRLDLAGSATPAPVHFSPWQHLCGNWSSLRHTLADCFTTPRFAFAGALAAVAVLCLGFYGYIQQGRSPAIAQDLKIDSGDRLALSEKSAAQSAPAVKRETAPSQFGYDADKSKETDIAKADISLPNTPVDGLVASNLHSEAKVAAVAPSFPVSTTAPTSKPIPVATQSSANVNALGIATPTFDVNPGKGSAFAGYKQQSDTKDATNTRSWALAGQNRYAGSTTATAGGLALDKSRIQTLERERRQESSDHLAFDLRADTANEAYQALPENAFVRAADEPLSTFSIDVDTAAYSNLRRFLNQGQLPPVEAVRIEEMLNYFSYNYPRPEGNVPFSANVEVARCPWNNEHKLVRIALKGRELTTAQRPPLNLVFLLDVSGSMAEPNKLPLVKRGMKLLLEKLTARDRVAIVTYAGTSRLALPSTPASQKQNIIDAIEALEAGGSTNGEGGIRQAYRVARSNFIEGGMNRVILSTDGDFNVGVSDRDQLTELIQKEARSGVFLSVYGFGMGNLKDATLQQLADKGNGVYGYIDNYNEARKVFSQQINGSLVTIAKDVKLQIDFNPARVGAYRLIGYEKRMLNKEDFNDDRKDAGEIGAGHTVTALYEITPMGSEVHTPGVEPSKYLKKTEPTTELADAARSNDLLTVRLRYKQPDADESRQLSFPVTDRDSNYTEASPDFKFAASVASFGLLLRDSPYRGSSNYKTILELAHAGRGEDEDGTRSEFIHLVETARDLRP